MSDCPGALAKLVFRKMHTKTTLMKLKFFSRKAVHDCSQCWKFELKISSDSGDMHFSAIKPRWGGCPPPPWFEFLVIFDFLHHGIQNVERHLLWKFHEKIQRKSWSNVPPKLGACIRFLNKVVHKIGRLRKFNRSREIEFNFFTAWTIFMKLGTLVHYVYGYKTLPQIF